MNKRTMKGIREMYYYVSKKNLLKLCPNDNKKELKILCALKEVDILGEVRRLFIKYLTESSETQDARRKEFNQAIFDAKEGWACYSNTDLDMVIEKFDRAIAELGV